MAALLAAWETLIEERAVAYALSALEGGECHLV
jgi:hypothetical protein